MVALPTSPPPHTPTPALTPAQHEQLLELLPSTDHSLSDIAQALNISLAHLTLFLTSDEGQDLAATIQAACNLRTRLVATALLPRAVHTITINLDDYDARARAAHLGGPALTDTHHDRARRAAHLLLRIATLSPKRFHTPTPPFPSTASAAAGTRATGNGTTPPPQTPRAQPPAPVPTRHHAPGKDGTTRPAPTSTHATPPAPAASIPAPPRDHAPPRTAAPAPHATAPP